MVSMEFFVFIILPAALGPWVWLNDHRNEYHEYFLGSECGRCLRLKHYQPHVPTVLQSGSLNLVESPKLVRGFLLQQQQQQHHHHSNWNLSVDSNTTLRKHEVSETARLHSLISYLKKTHMEAVTNVHLIDPTEWRAAVAYFEVLSPHAWMDWGNPPKTPRVRSRGAKLSTAVNCP